MPVAGTHHVAIAVSDLDASLDFYTRLLGLRHANTRLLPENLAYKLFGHVGSAVRCAKMYAGWRGRVLLYHFESGLRDDGGEPFSRRGLQYLSFVVDDLEEMGRALETAGVEIIREPTTYPTGEKVVFLLDPDRTVIQLMENRLTASPIGRILQPLARYLTRHVGRTRQAAVGATMKKEVRS